MEAEDQEPKTWIIPALQVDSRSPICHKRPGTSGLLLWGLALHYSKGLSQNRPVHLDWTYTGHSLKERRGGQDALLGQGKAWIRPEHSSLSCYQFICFFIQAVHCWSWNCRRNWWAQPKDTNSGQHGFFLATAATGAPKWKRVGCRRGGAPRKIQMSWPTPVSANSFQAGTLSWYLFLVTASHDEQDLKIREWATCWACGTQALSGCSRSAWVPLHQVIWFNTELTGWSFMACHIKGIRPDVLIFHSGLTSPWSLNRPRDFSYFKLEEECLTLQSWPV